MQPHTSEPQGWHRVTPVHPQLRHLHPVPRDYSIEGERAKAGPLLGSCAVTSLSQNKCYLCRKALRCLTGSGDTFPHTQVAYLLQCRPGLYNVRRHELYWGSYQILQLTSSYSMHHLLTMPQRRPFCLRSVCSRRSSPHCAPVMAATLPPIPPALPQGDLASPWT